jgi:hypothetical protein
MNRLRKTGVRADLPLELLPVSPVAAFGRLSGRGDPAVAVGKLQRQPQMTC